MKFKKGNYVWVNKSGIFSNGKELHMGKIEKVDHSYKYNHYYRDTGYLIRFDHIGLYLTKNEFRVMDKDEVMVEML